MSFLCLDTRSSMIVGTVHVSERSSSQTPQSFRSPEAPHLSSSPSMGMGIPKRLLTAGLGNCRPSVIKGITVSLL